MTLERVAYVTGEYPRATDTFIQREVAALRAGGLDVHTFAVRRTGDEHMVGPEQRAERDRTTYLLPPSIGGLARAHARLFVASPRRYLGALGLAWNTRREGLRGTLKQLAYVAEAGLLADELRRRDIEHLHAHFADSATSLAMLTAAIGGLRYSFTLHGPGIFFEADTWHLGTKCDRADFVACISYFARSQAMVFASPDTTDRLKIVHCGIDAAASLVADHVGADRSQIVFVARVAQLKGLGVLLEAMPEVVSRNPEATLVVVGDGPDRARYEKRARQLGVADAVRFVGYQSQDEVRAHLADSAVFALPSFAEGVPVSLMEAMAAGLPVVTTQVGGITELVTDGVNGDVLRPGDVDTLADRLVKLLADADLRHARGVNGRAVVASEFDSMTEAGRLRALFEAAASGSTTPTRPEPWTAEVST